MEKFEDFVYEHIDFGEAAVQGRECIGRMETAEDFESFKKAVLDFDQLHRRIYTAQTLCEIRHTCDTLDEYYTKEQDYMDEKLPEFEEILTMFAKAFIREDMKEKAAEEWGSHIITMAEYQVKAFDPCLIELKKKDNALMSSYQNIMASSVIEFDGQELTLPGLMKYFRSEDRDMRIATMVKFGEFLHEKEAELDPLYDEMVKVRTEMGKKMGYDNFIPLGYLNMRRYDYDQADVENYRKQIRETVVPLTVKIAQAQAERIGAEKLMFYDKWYEYPDGNPEPVGNAKELTDKAEKMYSEIGKETEELFSLMKARNLLDLESRKGKAQGGYCTPIPGYGVPFIFANFNGTNDDVETFTHEFGHALNSWYMKDTDLIMQSDLTMETAEIHSTSMEFFTHGYMEAFFGDRAGKYRYSHLAGTLFAMAYECCVDEFQHEVYGHYDMTPDERKAVWHRLEQTYMPFWDFGGDKNLERGLYWLRQLHIFECPFYYIDYSLASLNALEFYTWMKRDPKEAWDHYILLSRTGGTLPYRQVLKKAGLSDPFEDGTLAKIVGPLEEELEEGVK